jgi:hypothetical protein
MDQIDHQLQGIVDGVLEKTDLYLEFCPVHTDPLPPPIRYLFSPGIIILVILWFLSGIPLFAFLGGLLMIFFFVYFGMNYRNYLLVATETHVILIRVSGNLLKQINTQRIHYSEVESITEPMSDSIVISLKAGNSMRLKFHNKLAKFTSGEERMDKILEILRSKVPGGR